MKLDNRVHRHPKLEKEKGIDENHVIIDRELYIELFAKFGDNIYCKNKEIK